MSSLLVTSDAVLVCDDAETVLGPSAVLIEDGEIVEIGDMERLGEAHPEAEQLDGAGCVLLPGWINTHTHLAMNIFRGLTDDVTLEVFLERLVAAEFETLTPEMVATGVRAALAECLLGGTTGALDMYFFHEAAARVAAEVGFRLANGPTFIGAAGIGGAGFDELVRSARDELTAVASAGGTPWVMPHSAYTLTTQQLAELAALAGEVGARIHTHCAESPGEMELVREQQAARPLAVLDDAGLIGPRTVLAHMTQTSEDELPVLAAAGAHVAHCPASNLKLACGIAPVAGMLDAGINVACGTDGAASAGALDMLQAVRLAALLAKGQTQDPTVLPAYRAVRMATAGAARALGWDYVGQVAVGMRADLQLVDLSGPASAPRHDPAARLVYSASSADVRHVLVDGSVVVRDRELRTIDRVAALADLQLAADRASRVVARLAGS